MFDRLTETAHYCFDGSAHRVRDRYQQFANTLQMYHGHLHQKFVPTLHLLKTAAGILHPVQLHRMDLPSHVQGILPSRAQVQAPSLQAHCGP